MKFKILLLISVLTYLSPLVSSQDPVVIIAVSTRIGVNNASPYGSLKGGTQLYIQATGLDSTASNNAVSIGKYPCAVSDKGVNGIYLTCVTSAPDPTDENLTNLPIVITVARDPILATSTCTFSKDYCVFTYSDSYTPQLNYVSPRSIYPRYISAWNAKYTVSSNDVKWIEGQYINMERCDRFGIKDKWSTDIDSSSDNVVCQVSGNIGAGYYTYLLNTANGYDKNSFGVWQRKITSNELYQSKIVPYIVALSSNSISPKGQQLKITGYGFSSNPSDVSIKIPGNSQPVQILSASNREITALIPPLTAPTETNFLQSSGLKYTRYDFTGASLNNDCDGFRTQLLNNPTQISSLIQQDEIYPEPEQLDTMGENYGEFYRGFFKAPKTGKYRFYLASDDCAQVYLQTTPGIQSPATMTKVNVVDGYTPFRNYWIAQQQSATPTTISAQQDLVQDNYYYIEIYHMNGGGAGHFTASVEIEFDTRQERSLYDLFKLSTSFTAIQEQLTILLYNSAGNQLLTGNYMLKFFRKDSSANGVSYSYITESLSASANANQVRYVINNVGYKVNVVATKVDNTGTALADQTSATFAGYSYLVTFTQYRGAAAYQALPTLTSSTLGGGTLVYSATQTQAPCDPISGTFQVSVDVPDTTGTPVPQVFYFIDSNGNKVYDLPFNVDQSILANNINQIYGEIPMVWSSGKPESGRDIYLYMRGIDTITNFQVSTNNLLSGNGPVTATITNSVPKSNNVLFEPIPNELLFQFSSAPQVQVEVKGFLAGCPGTVCEFSLSNSKTPTVLSFTQTGSQLSVTLLPGTGLPTLTFDQFKITHAGANCLPVTLTKSGANYIASCPLEQQNGVTVSQAGDNIPIVHVDPIGYTLFDAAVTAVTQALTVTSDTPAAGSPDGGTQLVLNGVGFPKDFNQAGFTLTISGVSVKPISISNKQIVLQTPPQGTDETIELAFNGKTFTSSSLFTYDPNLRLQVSALSFNNKSPIFKGNLVITATNLGSTSADLNITLESTTLTKQKIYIAPVVSLNSAANQVTVYLRGGMPGDYLVIVNRKDFGRSSPVNAGDNKFSYGAFITGVSPSTGSEAGGTVITITGYNFVVSESLAFVGSAVNWYCDIDKSLSTSTTIVCTTPAKSEEGEYSGAVDVAVVTRGSLESTCAAGSTCTFQYVAASTPVISSLPTGALSTTGARLLSKEEMTQPTSLKFKTTKKFLWTPEFKKPGLNHLQHYGTSKRRNLLTADQLVLDHYKVYNAGDAETLSGTGFTDPVKVFFKGSKQTYQTTATLSGSTITYTIPQLPQGDYGTYVQTAVGYGNKIWVTRIKLVLSTISPSSVVPGGQIITLNGQGFNTAQAFSVYFGTSTLCLEINVVSTTQATCRTPSLAAGAYTITVSQKDIANSAVITSPINNGLTVLATSASPIASTLTTTSTITAGATNMVYSGDVATLGFTFTGTNLGGTTAVITLETPTNKYTGTVTTTSATSVTASFTNVPVGFYLIQYNIDGKYAQWSNLVAQKLAVAGSAPTTTLTTASYAGGATLTFTGKGFDTTLGNNQVSVCGFPATVTAATFTTLTVQAPPFPSAGVFTTYTGLQTEFTSLTPDQVTLTADLTTSVSSNFFDGLQTTYYRSTATSCFVQIDFGTDRVYELQAVRYIPRVDIEAIIFSGAKFQYSTDGTAFVDLFTISSSVHSGFNIYAPQATIKGIKKIKFIDTREATGSFCQLAEVEFRGRITHGTANPSTTATTCGAQIKVNGQTLPAVASSVSYSNTVTPTVTAVSQTFVPNGGSSTLTITGTGFGTVTANVQVNIDNVPCTVTTASGTQVVCTTGVKDPSTNSVTGQFSVSVNGNLAANSVITRYGNLWSDLNTWGGVVAPGDGDSVVVEAGQTLVVDTITPKLVQLLIQGNLFFADNGSPVSLDAHYIVISDGKFQLGTEAQPFQSQATITLRGAYEEVQMPALGNKVLGCHMCTFDLHGKVRTPTWTLLSSTVAVGASTLTVDDTVDWQVGEQIVVTSSEIEHTQAEVRTIVSVSGKTITVDQPFLYQHYSAVETYGTTSFPIKTEVGLLSRNVKVTGEPSALGYGYHLMIHGDAAMGTSGKISYTEFTNGGQPLIKGRYPVHFHLNGDVYGSYVRGNSIHDNYARCVTIHGVHFLTVEKNVCYNTFGHAIFLEDGIETDNIIQDNLVASIRQIWNMLQTDITVATFWITNPQNIVRRNRSGGSEWYGFWYEIKDNPDGPSATSDICPPGLNVLEFDTNYAHSNGRFGLRIFKLQPRQFPCRNPRNDSNPDPFMDNPSIPGQFTNFWTWKNNEAGILAEELGGITFDKIYIAESGVTGFQGHKANFTKEGVLLTNSIIVGQSSNPSPSPTFYQNTFAMIVPRTNGFKATNIGIYNYPAGSTILQSGSQNWNLLIWVVGGKNTIFQNVKITNSPNANIVSWQMHKREIFWDMDGSITGISGGAYISPYKEHFVGVTGCTAHPEAKWGNSHICAMNQVQVRDILFNNPQPGQDFTGTDLKIYRLTPDQYSAQIPATITADKYTNETMLLIMSGDMTESYASVFATGQVYNIHFNFGTSDPTSMGIFASPLFASTDKGIVLRFNYTAVRETFDIFKNEGGKFTKTYVNISSIPDPATCNQGDWFIDNTNKFLFLCLSGKGKSFQEFVEVQGVTCRTTCSSIGTTPLENKIRLWSDPTSWAGNQVPAFNSSPIIQGGYQILLDVDPPALYNLTLYGNLIFDETKPTTILQANYIFAKSGKILAGNSTNPFPGAITIQLNGKFGEENLLIDDEVDASNKILAVTYGIELYGTPPGTTWTRLTSFASAGDKTITVESASDWNIGDQIVVGPSGSLWIQNEVRLIKFISGTTITLNAPLLYDHYGAPQVTIDKPNIGQLDMRSAVGHLTRKIKIVGGPDPNGWGGRVLIYQFLEPGSTTGVPKRGYAVLQGVEFVNMGQYGTSRGALDFRSLNSDLIKTPSIVNGCSFHDSTGMFLNAQESQYITVTNNVFYNGQKALVQMINNKYVKFLNNLMILVTIRPAISTESGLANWAVFGNFVYDDHTPMTTDYLEVAGNVGQGSQDTGFFFMATSCSSGFKASFHDNQCSGAFLACIGYAQSDGVCDYIKGSHAYHSQIGVMAALATEELRTDQLILAENNVNLVQKMGNHQILNNVFTLTNTFITTYAIPGCPQCYSDNTKPFCKGSVALQMATISSAAFPPISNRPSSAFDTICTVQAVDQKVYTDQVTFEGFKHQYTETNYCGYNAVFRQHGGASDSTAQYYLTNTKCQNCNNEGLLYGLRDSNIGQIGWFGGCGSFICTGQINILVEDQDGQFFGQVGQAIGNNTYFGPNVTYCTRNEPWNGYFCPGNKISMLNFYSTAADHNKRLYSPVQLTDGVFFNQLNSYKEWDWDGPEPLNKRESRFLGIISVNSTINMTNAGDNPTSSQYWLAKRQSSGSPSDWVIIKLQFSGPQTIQVLINGTVQKPGLTLNNAHWDLSTKTSVCGANNYFYLNRTIHFIVTGALECLVTISLKNTLQITSRIAITESSFFGPNFLSYAIAQIGGDPYNYFILGTSKVSRRQLQGTTAATDVTWGILDNSVVGEPEATGATVRLKAIQQSVAKLLNVVGSPYVITSQTETVQAVEVVSYPSTEPTTGIKLIPGTTTSGNGVTTGTNQNNSSTGSSSGSSSGQAQGQQQQNVEQGGKSNNSSGSDYDQNVNIAVSVIMSIVGVSLIAGGIIWFKKSRQIKVASIEQQKAENVFQKANQSDEGINALSVRE